MSIVCDPMVRPGFGVIRWRASWGHGQGEPITLEYVIRVGELWEAEQHCVVTVLSGGESHAAESCA